MRQSFCFKVLAPLTLIFIHILGQCAEPVTEIVLVGTQHFISDMPDGYTPAHLRSLLNKIEPAAVLVETGKVNGTIDWTMSPLELTNITKPWAEIRKTPIFAVNEFDPGYSAKFFQAMRAKDGGIAYQKAETAFQFASSQQAPTCEFMNGNSYHKLWRDYHTELHRLYEKETPWENWNEKVVKNILTACRDFKGKRVAVVYGAAHLYFFADKLTIDPEIRLIPTSTFFPLTKAELDAATEVRDYAFAMRVLNFEALDPAVLPNLESQLEKLAAFPALQNDLRFFRGKLLMHKGRYADAETEFNALSSAKANEVLVFDNTSSVRDTSRVYAAITCGKGGDWKSARALLSKLLDEDVSSQTKAWIQQIIAYQIPAQPKETNAEK